MNILLIKQTSLGDVLHATPHIRAIRQAYPDAHLTVLTSEASAAIYEHHPDVDRLVLFDDAAYKRAGLSSPRKLRAVFKVSLDELNDREYDLAFDLQGLVRSVVFLYLVRAGRKYVKGRWLGLNGFRNKQLHAIDEMSQVLALAGIETVDTRMAFYRGPHVAAQLQEKLQAQDLQAWLGREAQKPYIIISPFTRWPSKNWPLADFIELAGSLSQRYTVVLTAAPSDRDLLAAAVQQAGPALSAVHSLAGVLSLAELAELMSDAGLVISGDSFPMHLATAVSAPLLTLFGPTDESKTGPRSDNSVVMRPDNCNRCDRPRCARACLSRIGISEVAGAAQKLLETGASAERNALY